MGPRGDGGPPKTKVWFCSAPLHPWQRPLKGRRLEFSPPKVEIVLVPAQDKSIGSSFSATLFLLQPQSIFLIDTESLRDQKTTRDAEKWRCGSIQT